MVSLRRPDSTWWLDDGVDITYGISTNIDLYGVSNRQLQIQWNHYEFKGSLRVFTGFDFNGYFIFF